MKKSYRKPLVERIEFAYGDQVVAESIEKCTGLINLIRDFTDEGSCKRCMEDVSWNF